MYFWYDNQNFEWASSNRSFDQLTKIHVVNIFARQHARDGSIIKHALPYAHSDACTRASVASSQKIKDREQ